MSYYNRFIIIAGLLLTSTVQAYEAFLEGIYWRATESVDWALLIDTTPMHQSTSYQTACFDYQPGFRIGLGGISLLCWKSALYYTHFETSTSDAISGNVTPAFLGSKFAQPSTNYFYQSGQMNFNIHLNMLDLDFSRCYNLTDRLQLKPVFGLKAGWIDQSIFTTLQGDLSVQENISNNFTGLGPKIGIDGDWRFINNQHYSLSFIASFASSFLWGHWSIKDNLSTSTGKITNIILHTRDLGGLAIENLIAIKLDCHCFSVKLSYEISDWFNQCQIFDDDTGAHNNDLILQGLSLRFTYTF